MEWITQNEGEWNAERFLAIQKIVFHYNILKSSEKMMVKLGEIKNKENISKREIKEFIVKIRNTFFSTNYVRSKKEKELLKEKKNYPFQRERSQTFLHDVLEGGKVYALHEIEEYLNNLIDDSISEIDIYANDLLNVYDVSTKKIDLEKSMKILFRKLESKEIGRNNKEKVKKIMKDWYPELCTE